MVAQLCMNGYALSHPVPPPIPKTVKQVPYEPKPTGSMSFPLAGLGVVLLSAVMLFTMDSFLGFGWVSLVACGARYDYEEAYDALHATVAGHPLNSRTRVLTAALGGSQQGEEGEVLLANMDRGGGNKEVVV